MPMVLGRPTGCGDCIGNEPSCRCCPYGTTACGVAYRSLDECPERQRVAVMASWRTAVIRLSHTTKTQV
jgi:hypothetical protein